MMKVCSGIRENVLPGMILCSQKYERLTAEHEIKYQKWTLNDTHGEKLCFIQLSTKNGWLAASDLFHIFTQLIKFYYTFHYHVLGVQMFGKCDSSNKQ